jgi:hypothetical protein
MWRARRRATLCIASGQDRERKEEAMPRVEVDIETATAPEEVRAALLDFTARRPEIWPGIAPTQYEVYRVEATSADIKEGSKVLGGTFWAKEHYDWSTPGVITWTVQESNFCAPGSSVSAAISPLEGGGSRIHVTWDRTPTSLMGRIAAFAIVRSKGKPVRASMEMGLKRIEELRAA